MKYLLSSPSWCDKSYEVYCFKKNKKPVVGNYYTIKNRKAVKINSHEAVIHKLKDKLVYKVDHVSQDFLVAALIKI